MAGRRGNRCDSDVADSDRNPSADFGPFHEHRARHLMPPAQTERDHRTSAARRSIGDNGASILKAHLLTLKGASKAHPLPIDERLAKSAAKYRFHFLYGGGDEVIASTKNDHLVSTPE